MNRTSINLILASLLMILSLGAQANKLKIVLRYDDYSRYTSMQLAADLIEMAKHFGGGLMIGVIPFPYGEYPEKFDSSAVPPPFLNKEKTELLKKYLDEGSIEVALHGFSHKNNTPEGQGRHSEFSGLPEEKQTVLLKTAKASLEHAIGHKVRVFVPPFNQYDAITLDVLKNAGFELVSGGMMSFSSTDSTLKFLPGTTYVNNLKAVVETAIQKGHTEAMVVVTMHPYDIVESGEKMEEFRKDKQVSLQQIRNDLAKISKMPDIEISSVKRLLDEDEDLAINRWKSNLRLKKNAITRYHLLPETFNLYPVKGLYYSRDAAERLITLQQLATLALYTTIFLVTAIISWLLVRLLSHRVRRSSLLISTLSLAGIALAGILFALKGIHPLLFTVFACCFGALIGAATFRAKHRTA
jgi:peptidoglycan/xylan/chitin deacetylase (PgdA/CDA1 family)